MHLLNSQSIINSFIILIMASLVLLLIELPAAILFAVFGGLTVSILSFKDVRIGVCCLIILSIFPGIVTSHVSTIKGLRLFNLIFLSTCIGLAVNIFLNNQEKYRIVKSALDKPLILLISFYWLLPLVYSFFSKGMLTYEMIINNFIKPLQYIIIYFLVLFTAKNKKVINIYLISIIIGFVVSSVMYYSGVSFSLSQSVGYSEARESTIFEPNLFAMYVSYLIVFFIAIYHSFESKTKQIAMLAIILFGSYVLLSTLSRSGLISFLITVPIILCYVNKRIKLIILLFMIFSGFYVVYQSSKPTTFTRSAELYRESLKHGGGIDFDKYSIGRIHRLHKTVIIINNDLKILLFGNYRSISIHEDAHNAYLEALFNSGVIGLVALLWVYYICLKTCTHIYRKNNDVNYSKWLALGGIFSTFSILSSGMFMAFSIGSELLVPFLVIMAVNMSINMSEGNIRTFQLKRLENIC